MNVAATLIYGGSALFALSLVRFLTGPFDPLVLALIGIWTGLAGMFIMLLSADDTREVDGGPA